MSARRTRAFTLVEALMASVILTCAFLPVLGVMMEGTRITAWTVDDLYANCYVSDLLDQLQSAQPEVEELTTLSTADGGLADGMPVPGGHGATFHLAHVPAGCTVTLTLSPVSRGLVRARACAVTTGTSGMKREIVLESLLECGGALAGEIRGPQ